MLGWNLRHKFYCFFLLLLMCTRLSRLSFSYTDVKTDLALPPSSRRGAPQTNADICDAASIAIAMGSGINTVITKAT